MKENGSKSTEKTELLAKLQHKAEELFNKEPALPASTEFLEVQKLFHELQVYQNVLEVQNDELSIVANELKLQRTTFANLFEMAPVGYIVLNRKGCIIDINRTGCELFSTNKHQVLGSPLLSCVHQDDASAFYTFFRQMLNSPGEQRCQLRLLRSDKVEFYAQLDGICIENTPASTCYLIITDITEQKQADIRLREASRNLKMALDASSTGVWDIDIITGKIRLDNFSCSLYGINPGDFDGRLITVLYRIAKDDRAKVYTNLRTAMTGNKIFSIEFKVGKLPDIKKYISAHGQMVTDQQHSRRFVGIFTDVTERKMMEQNALTLRDNQHNLITSASLQAEENERKRISETLHDSTSQMMYAAKLNLQQIKGLDQDPYLKQANSLIDQTIRDLRNISFELAPSILKDFGLAITLEELSRRLSNDHLAIQTKVTGVGANLDINIALNIYRIIQELVNNSIKHADGDKIKVEVTRKSDVIAITVTDNGKGFNVASINQTSVGTGLSSIRKRCNLYKGKIDISSAPGEGTRVTVTIKQNA